MDITHGKISALADSGGAGLIHPSDWNDVHQVVPGKLDIQGVDTVIVATQLAELDSTPVQVVASPGGSAWLAPVHVVCTWYKGDATPGGGFAISLLTGAGVTWSSNIFDSDLAALDDAGAATSALAASGDFTTMLDDQPLMVKASAATGIDPGSSAELHVKVFYSISDAAVVPA